MAISMLKIRRPLGRLIFNMGIAIPGKTVFLIETAPWKPLCVKMFMVDFRVIGKTLNNHFAPQGLYQILKYDVVNNVRWVLGLGLAHISVITFIYQSELFANDMVGRNNRNCNMYDLVNLIWTCGYWLGGKHISTELLMLDKNHIWR